MKTEKFLACLIAGAIAGGTLAILVTPKPGRDARKVLGRSAGVASRQVAHCVDAVKNRIRKEPDDVLVGSHSDNGTG